MASVANQDFHQAEQEVPLDLALDLCLLVVSSPLVELGTLASAMLVHLEPPAPAPFAVQETSASAREADSRLLALAQQAAVPYQVVHLEPPVSAWEVELGPLALAWEESPEAAALP